MLIFQVPVVTQDNLHQFTLIFIPVIGAVPLSCTDLITASGYRYMKIMKWLVSAFPKAKKSADDTDEQAGPFEILSSMATMRL